MEGGGQRRDNKLWFSIALASDIMVSNAVSVGNRLGLLSRFLFSQSELIFKGISCITSSRKNMIIILTKVLSVVLFDDLSLDCKSIHSVYRVGCLFHWLI